MKSGKSKTRFNNQQYINIQSHPGVQWKKNYQWESEIPKNILMGLFTYTRVCLYTLTVCIFLQLILSGDVESNPGPVG